eukprot:scaffold19324_cov152-Cylindrotheca_fusiformis.AAC.12
MKRILQSCFLIGAAVVVSGFLTTPANQKNPPGPMRNNLQERLKTTTSLLASSAYRGTVQPPSGRTNNHHRRRRRRQIHKDVVIVGGGLAGLSAALYLSQIDPDRQICILDKHELLSDEKTSVATFAAAGMLAPHSERLPKGDYLNLCLRSKKMFPDFADMVECMAQEAGEEGMPYLSHSSGSNKDKDNQNGLEPWNIGYVASGGFLAPAFAGDTVATWAPPEDTKGSARWLDETQVRELEPNLHPNVVGGWWFPEDASVDSRRLAASLRAACVGAGVQLLSGKNYEVSSLDLEDGNCNGLWLKNGKYIESKTLLVANGAWMRQLLPVPMEPHKGQSLSLRMPTDRPPILRRVMFAADCYIVPKADGRIVVGATVEAGNFSPHVTPAGIMHILNYALQVVPELADLPIEETWAGLRPTTPDKGPILGKTPWNNLYLAGGYWRNGVLLAPKTGELLAMLMAGEELSEEDEQFLEAFAWDRFTSEEGGGKMAADARYAASMYPVHTRKSGVGVAASVGTELGSYSTAVSAREERQRDRASMFGDSDEGMAAFERAASMGKADGRAFSFGGEAMSFGKQDQRAESIEEESRTPINASKDAANRSTETMSFDKQDESAASSEGDSSFQITERDNAADTSTDTDSSQEGGEVVDLKSVYNSIRENKSKEKMERGEALTDERPDPGFRIFHIDEDGTHREVPPYTAPADFLSSINGTQGEEEPVSGTHAEMVSSENDEEGSQASFDGYQTILEAAEKDDDIHATMRAARLKNRNSYDDKEGDVSVPGLREVNANDEGAAVPEAAKTPGEKVSDSVKAESSQGKQSISPEKGMSDIYQQIRDQKAAKPQDRNKASPDDRPDPGFRIHHIDENGTHREVPPYTAPADFLESIKTEYAQPTNGAATGEASVPTRQQSKEESPPAVPSSNGKSEEYNEKTYDGYQALMDPNKSREEELEAMRKARQQNRAGREKANVDEESLGINGEEIQGKESPRSQEKGMFM